ncbi:MAG: DVUA0089 family protein, partial [Fimbriimonadales bacterium]|nr:DVUA0089 family protein [Fimbriimonadales bacterium]
ATMLKRILWSIVATSALLTLAHAQITHQEQGDAGDLPETAQATGTDTTTQLGAIRGVLGANDVDMYVIYIANPQAFVATTVNNNTTFDTQLWLFDSEGKGVAFNDDVAGDTSRRSRIDNSSGLLTNRTAGIYYIAVSRYNRAAIGCTDRLIWTATPFTGVRAPNGPDAASRVSGWLGNTSAAGNYEITLTGAFTAPAQSNIPPCPPFDGWDETDNGGGDAGDLPITAQIITRNDAQPCQTPIQRVRGRLGVDDVDMYVICITDPAQFSASTVGTTDWDTQLWLFRCNGLGVVHNDDNPDASQGLQSRIHNRTNCISQAGVYLLAISRYNRDPVARDGQPLWNPAGAARGVRCPDGIRANQPVAAWAGATLAEPTRYIIQLTGASFVSASGCCITAGGDVNLDNCIDDADLLAVLFAFGNTGTFLPEDVTCDGIVDDADLLVVLFNFGQGC